MQHNIKAFLKKTRYYISKREKERESERERERERERKRGT